MQLNTVNAAKQPLVVGVYAYQSPLKVTQEYQPLISFMALKLPNLDIQLNVLSAPDLKEAVRKGQVDVLITSPNLYEEIRHENFITGVAATVQRQYEGVATTSLGGVIFTLANNTQFTHLQDVQHAKIATPSLINTGAYRVPLYELHKANLNYTNLNLLEVGCNDAVVEAILLGDADVGFVRTGVLEDWFERGDLSPQAIRVINQRTLKSFPFLLSTQLMPEWPVVIMPKVSSALSREVLSVLYQFNNPSEHNNHGRIANFAPPLDYKPFENMLREMKLSPYDVTPKPTFSSIWSNYWHFIALGLLLFLVILVAFILAEGYRRKIWQIHLRLSQVVDATRVGTWEWSPETGRIIINEHYASQIGYQMAELLPFNYTKWQALVAPDDLDAVQQKINHHFSHPNLPYQADFRLKHKKGHWVWIHAKGLVVDHSPNGLPLLMDGTHTDISLQKKHELLLNKEANFDHLTGLMNRNYFMHSLEATLNKIVPSVIDADNSDSSMTQALVFIDLDNFKPVNDKYGHEAGDAVLKSFAHLLKESLRPDDLACRLGGDEFILLIQNIAHRAQLDSIINRILTQLQTPMIYDQNPLNVSCSIGVYDYVASQTSINLPADEAVKKADLAMYQAKASGKNKVVFYST
ncbi:diguanylate cyclase domain-containing protein [Thiomicrorhabdus aquaedulcis]|uniref:diguanylate cyclase domain-containing protein n=1 Tax=Thiomicrorhabdus aquaedulcis TaxID=2211106 RepID=UPI000FD75AB2|nr:diguanylate cyclase [Thiomicrorhabdus aquaedulcis]